MAVNDMEVNDMEINGIEVNGIEVNDMKVNGMNILTSLDDATLPALPPGVERLVLPVQTHTVNVAVVTTNPNDTYPDTDALVSFDPAVAVGVRTADCVPVMLQAGDIGAVAAIHAGWKGTLGRIVAHTVDLLVARDADPAAMQAYIGPAICGDCYEVSAELTEQFHEAGLSAGVSDRHIDLREVNRNMLIEAGLRKGNISVSPHCTRHTTTPLYPSWRRRPGITRRLVTAISLLPSGQFI